MSEFSDLAVGEEAGEDMRRYGPLTLERAGDHERAIAHFRRAAERTTSLAERNYLLVRAARLSEAREE